MKKWYSMVHKSCDSRVDAIKKKVTLKDAHRYGFSTKEEYARAIVYGHGYESQPIWKRHGYRKRKQYLKSLKQ